MIKPTSLNVTMRMTWGRLILPSPSKKRPKKHFPGRSGANHTVHHGFSSILLVTSFGHPVDESVKK